MKLQQLNLRQLNFPSKASYERTCRTIVEAEEAVYEMGKELDLFEKQLDDMMLFIEERRSESSTAAVEEPRRALHFLGY
ncbi:hypothetical protein NEOLI_000825 [Neolecta irregularis DAH-3]|uniref:Uncharacterized protein n=1 Tax=Neolecta irregularis (strain DAH-3) TaxID=1198029 RepID=A0A1U7LRJ5_NEOID|nr:hypothetical protein NEOLI_000825 [Neolecta irregularis DAH-3]|eukprot:OLL25249.1 hypothetical protein NEOLI_000825 [Neolecta irregularis DAH-3]